MHHHPVPRRHSCHWCGRRSMSTTQFDQHLRFFCAVLTERRNAGAPR